MWISGALFEQMRFFFGNLIQVIFWTKVELFYKNPWKRSVIKWNFRIHEIWTRKLIFSLFTQKQLGIHDGTKNRLNALSHQLLEKTSRVTNKIHTFFISNSFFNSASVLLTFSWIDLQMLLRCCLIHISIIILRQLFIYYMPRPRTISCLCDLFFILIIIFTMINHVISLIQTQFLKIN